MDQENDAEIITNIFEIQILHRFGITPNWTHCAICGKTDGRFDYSSKYSGILCEQHWGIDERRYHADSRAIHFIRLFSQIILRADCFNQIKARNESRDPTSD